MHFQKKFEKLSLQYLFVLFTGFLSRITAMIMSYTIVDNNFYVFDNTNHDAFCKYKQNVIDFLPILHASGDVSYKYRLHHFYGCELKSTHISSYFFLFGSILAIILVPSMNGFLFYQFVKRMNQLLQNMNKVSCNRNRINEERLFITYLNVIIGVSSVSTTLISISLSIFNPSLFMALLYFDLILNGYFMLIIFKFGNKLLCQCCKNRIWALVHKKTDKLQAPSSSEPSL